MDNVSPSTAPVKGTRPDVRLYPISEIKLGPRCRKDMGDLDALADSIRALGTLLQPVGLGPDLELIFGERRLRAVQLLGWEEVPVIVFAHLDEAVLAARAERDENTCRKEFAPTEMVEMGRRLEALESSAAAERRDANLKQNASEHRGADSAPRASGKTRERVAAALGVSHDTYTKAKRVVEAARQNPAGCGDLPGVMDATSVNAAHREMTKRRSEGTPADPPHRFAELMARVTGTAALVTREMGAGDEAADRLREYLSWCGAVDNGTGDVIDHDECRDADAVFLPLRGLRKIIDLAGQTGRRLTRDKVIELYMYASGGWEHPFIARLRDQKAAPRGGRQ